MKKDVSVIIPVYNGEKTLESTIESVLNQSYKNFEIIIVNDGSTDNTISIINNYSKLDRRINVIHQDNAGVSSARNSGIKNSEGTYICFLDADDLYEQNFLEKMVSKIKKTNMEVCYCGFNYYPIKKRKKILDRFISKDVLLNYIRGRIPAHTSTWLIEKKVLLKNNIYFNEKLSWGEDLEFFYQVLATSEKVVFVPEYLTLYRDEDSENRLSSFSLEKINEDYKFIWSVIENKKINKNSKIENALLNYRLPALISNKLELAIQKNYDTQELRSYYKKYHKYLESYEWSNGVRSFKLNLLKMKLNSKLG